MFSYVQADSLLHRRNPVFKLIIVILWSLLASFSYYPVLPTLTFLITFLAIWILGKIPAIILFKKLFVFIAVSVIFMISMMVLRGLSPETDPVLRLWILQWSKADIVQVCSLGFRILAIVTLSAGFVLTTKPQDLVLSLIMQCKVKPVYGYAAIAAYRFLPEFGEQVNTIHLAQEIRGIPWNRGIASRLSSPFRVLLPLLIAAARKGEHLACAMESRGLGRNGERTYYRKIKVEREDWIFLAAAAAFYILLVVFMIKSGLYHFSFASVNG